MVVVSGPTGSGKSTFMRLLKDMKRANMQQWRILSVSTRWREPGSSIEDIGLTFGSTLGSMLRQDPDVLLIGEIRDGETADIAVKFL